MEEVKFPYLKTKEGQIDLLAGIRNLFLGSLFKGKMKADDVFGGRLYDAVVDAAGNGDFTDIQSALDAGKKRIFVRNGTYEIDSSILITDYDVLIEGESMFSTKLEIKAGTYASGIAFFKLGIAGSKSASRCVIKKFYLYKDTGGVTGDVYGFHLDYSSRTLIKECYLDQLNYGISVRTSTSTNSRATITGNFFNGVSYPVHVVPDTGTKYYWIVTDNFIGYSSPGIYNVSDAAKYWIVSGNYMSMRGGANEGIYNTADECIFSNNILDSGFEEGIYNEGSKCIFEGNLIVKAGNHGIHNKGDYVVVKGNVICDAGDDVDDTYCDILLDGATYCSIIGNIMRPTAANKTKYGINEINSANYNVISGNIANGQVTAKYNIIGANTEFAHNV